MIAGTPSAASSATPSIPRLWREALHLVAEGVASVADVALARE
jgi:hypothetical protein